MGGGKTSSINSSSSTIQQNSSGCSISKPLVALLDGRDCSIEMPLLKDIATVAFCDAHLTTEIHEKVLNEAVAAFLYTIKITRDDLVKFRSLKVLVKIGNPDLSNIDVDAATQLGIAVCNTPADALEEIADHTMSLILNLYRRTYWLAQGSADKSNLKNSQQLREGMSGARRIRGQTLGIVGFGRVGCAVALRAKTFGFRVCFYDPNASLGMDRVFGVDRADNLNDLLSQSDCLTLHCKITAETRLMLNNSTLDNLKFGAFIVNTSDTDLIDQQALSSFLKSGHVKAAALDIPFSGEQMDGKFDESLLNSPNVICTPSFAAWFSEESLKDLRISAAREVRRSLTGLIPDNLQNCVNKDQLLALRLASLQQRFVIPPAFALPSEEHAAGLQHPLPPNLLAEQFFINQNNLAQQQPRRSVSTAIMPPQQLYLPQSTTTVSAPSSIDSDPSVAANFVNNATALMAYQSFMMRNPQYFAAAANAFSSPPATCSSASLHPGIIGGPSFEFSSPQNFLNSIPYIGGIPSHPQFSFASVTIGGETSINSASIPSQSSILSTQIISKTSPIISTNKLSPQQNKCDGRVSQSSVCDGYNLDNNNTIIDGQQNLQESSQWSPLSENSIYQQQQNKEDNLNEKNNNNVDLSSNQNQQKESQQKNLQPRTSTPYSPIDQQQQEQQLIIDDNNNEEEVNEQISRQQQQHNFGEFFNNNNNGGAGVI